MRLLVLLVSVWSSREHSDGDARVEVCINVIFFNKRSVVR